MEPITKELKLPRELPELKEPNELNPRRQRQGTSHHLPPSAVFPGN